MILLVRGRTVLLFGLLAGVCIFMFQNTWGKQMRVSVTDPNYRVFVAGTGTVEGRWCGETGIALIGLETRPAPLKGEELKIIDLLVANGGSEVLQFNADVSLINNHGERYSIESESQPKVYVNPGTLSQGTVIINVPEGNPDNNWFLEIKGGNLGEGVVLPLKVLKVVE